MKDGQITINGRPVFNADSAPLVNDGLKVGDLWVDTSNLSDLVINVCTSVSPLVFDIIATSGSPASITGASNVNTVGVGVFEGNSGNNLTFRGIAPTNSKLTATYDGTSKTINLDIVENQVNHNNLLNYQSNQHVDHSTTTITGSAGISGGGDLTSSRVLTLDINSLPSNTTPTGGDSVLIFDSGTSSNQKTLISDINISSFAGGFDAISPLTTKGDILGRTTTDNVRVPVGSDGLSIVADSAQTVGWKWSAVGTITNGANVNLTGVGVFENISTDTMNFKGVAAASSKISVSNNSTNKTVDLDVVQANVDHNSLLNFDANKHIDHSAVTITGTSGISGGGNLTSSRALSLDIVGLGTKNSPLPNDLIPINDVFGGGVNRKITVGSIQLNDLFGTVAISKGGTGQSSKTAAFNALSPLTTKGDITAFDGTNNVRQAAGVDGSFLKYDSSQSTGISSGNAVTSVSMTVPTGFSVTGSPITTTGTLDISLSGQTKQKALMSAITAATGSTSTPTFRQPNIIDIEASVKNGFSMAEDFLGNPGTYAWTNASSGGAVSGADFSTSSDLNNIGVALFSTGASSTGVGALRMNSVGFSLTGGDAYFESIIRIPVLRTAVQEFSITVGFSNAAASSGPSNGIYFRYDGSNVWKSVTRQSATQTVTFSAITVAANTWYKLSAYYNSSLNSVEFFVDGVSIGVHTTNIPSAAGQQIGPSLNIVKAVGTTSCTFLADTYCFFKELTTAR